MSVTAGVDRRAFKRWMNDCPLRHWRDENDVTIMHAASVLGVSMTLIQLWERGVHLPNPDNMRKLETLIGPGTAHRWADWNNDKPIVV